MIQAVLCDIEGTTTALSFVQKTLFPISRDQMNSYLHNHWNSSELRALVRSIGDNPDDVARVLRKWIDEDRKETILKQIQGKIWKDAFESGSIRAHVYPDVPRKWKEWKARGIGIYIFSSGSIEAQKLLFAHTESGDLTTLIDGYFDTTTGPKKDSRAYTRIAEILGRLPEVIVFLSDITAELDAARSGGMQTFHVVREEQIRTSGHQIVTSFDQIAI